VMAAMVVLNFLVIILITLVMICIHGNLYAKDANPLAYVIPKKKLTKAEKKVASAPPDMSCPLCHKPASSLQPTCPNCNADLVRWKQAQSASRDVEELV